MTKQKPKIELHVVCPYCKKPVVVRQYEETTEKAIPAEKKQWTTVEKDKQSKLPSGKDK